MEGPGVVLRRATHSSVWLLSFAGPAPLIILSELPLSPISYCDPQFRKPSNRYLIFHSLYVLSVPESYFLVHVNINTVISSGIVLEAYSVHSVQMNHFLTGDDVKEN